MPGTTFRSFPDTGTGVGAVDAEEAQRFLERAKDLVELARSIKSEQHRKILLGAAENFLKLAMEVLGRTPER